MFSSSLRACIESNQWQEALTLATEMQTHMPGSGDAAYAIFVAKLAAGKIDNAALTLAVAGRSADWVIQSLHEDLPSILKDDVNLRSRTGRALRRHLPTEGSVRNRATDESDQGYVNAIGTSMIRSFGANPIYFPLFIGMGNTLITLTEESAALMVDKFVKNLRRLDISRPLLIAAGAEPYMHILNYPPYCKFFPAPDEGQFSGDVPLRPIDYSLMQACAVRYRPILEEVRRLLPTGSVAMLGSTPNFHRNANALSVHFNQHLRVLCGQYDIVFVDVTNRLLDPATNLFQSRFSARAFNDDPHLNDAGLEVVTRALCAVGFLPPDALGRPKFDWSNVFQFNIVETEVTRIWCEPGVSPNNAVRSPKIACSFISEAVADLLTVECLERKASSLALFNVRDGFLPASLPCALKAECVSMSLDIADHFAARRVLAFAGRPDILLIRPDQDSLGDMNLDCDGGVVMAYPGSFSVDVEKARAFVAKTTLQWLMVVGPAEMPVNWPVELGYRLQKSMFVKNSHIPEVWREFSVCIYEKVQSERKPCPPSSPVG